MNPFQSLWIGGNLSLLEVMSIKSFLMNGHEYHLYTYGDVGNAPDGVKLKNAEEILPRSMAVRDQYGSYAFFSDKFRYKLLLDRGGWWVDTDMICLRHIDIEEPYCFGLEEPGRVNNAIIKTPENSLLIRSLWHYASQKEEHSPWGAIGPSLLTSLLSNESVKDLLKFVKPQDAFYPIHYSQWQLMFIERPTIDDLIPDSAYCVHLWNDMIRRGNAVIDKNFIFGHRSLIGSWQRRFIPEHC